jgi:protein-disulfide isomerase
VSLRPPVGAADHAQGPADAPVTLVEYGDYECPHCARAHPVVQAVRARLGDRLRFVFRNFPLTEIHPHALHAAEAAESVGAQLGEAGYWPMHDAIFEHQQDSRTALSDRHLAEYATAVGADGARVLADLEGDAHVERVQADFSSGVRSGVNGTPTFCVNGARYDGNWTDADAFATDLEAAARAAG